MTVKIERESDEYLKTTITSDVSLTAVPKFAFTQDDTRPTTWISGAWLADATQLGDGRYQRIVRTPLVGSASGIVLAAGTWKVWLQILDTPEAPMEFVDHLIIA